MMYLRDDSLWGGDLHIVNFMLQLKPAFSTFFFFSNETTDPHPETIRPLLEYQREHEWFEFKPYHSF